MDATTKALSIEALGIQSDALREAINTANWPDAWYHAKQCERIAGELMIAGITPLKPL